MTMTGRRMSALSLENDEQDTACGVPRFVQMSGHNHTSMVAHFNTGEDCLGREILDFLGPHI